jgi:catechol 2,3-dioxygenase-like lactoylglutathione lyase family enzyme
MPDKPVARKRTPAVPPGAVRGLDAVVLIARDFDRQVAFYRDVLGLEVAWAGHDAAFFRCGGQTLAVFAKSHHPQAVPRLDGARHGLSHLEFAVAAEDHDALSARLEAAGFRAYGDNFEDPDGNLFHFNVA